VIYLLDVSVLLAMCYRKHVHHMRTMSWLNDLERYDPSVRLFTCSITELGFVRIAANRSVALAQSVSAARQDLKHLKNDWSLGFVIDPLGAAHLPSWVERPPHVTDGHLLALAIARGGRLATLDSGIPDAFKISDVSEGPTMVREPTIQYGVESRHASRLN
jgi:uncharacterized protein